MLLSSAKPGPFDPAPDFTAFDFVHAQQQYRAWVDSPLFAIMIHGWSRGVSSLLFGRGLALSVAVFQDPGRVEGCVRGEQGLQARARGINQAAIVGTEQRGEESEIVLGSAMTAGMTENSVAHTLQRRRRVAHGEGGLHS